MADSNDRYLERLTHNRALLYHRMVSTLLRNCETHLFHGLPPFTRPWSPDRAYFYNTQTQQFLMWENKNKWISVSDPTLIQSLQSEVERMRSGSRVQRIRDIIPIRNVSNWWHNLLTAVPPPQFHPNEPRIYEILMPNAGIGSIQFPNGIDAPFQAYLQGIKTNRDEVYNQCCWYFKRVSYDNLVNLVHQGIA